jgi:hypothetical protein
LLPPECGIMGEFDFLRGSAALSSGLGTSPVDGGSSSVLKKATGGGSAGDGRSSSALNRTTGGGSAGDGRSSSALNRTTGAGGRGGGPCFSDYETVTQMNETAFWRNLTTKGKAISANRN